MRRDRRDQLASQGGDGLVALTLGQVALEDGPRGSLPEVGLEDRREGKPATLPPTASPVSPRCHRRGR